MGGNGTGGAIAAGLVLAFEAAHFTENVDRAMLGRETKNMLHFQPFMTDRKGTPSLLALSPLGVQVA